MSVSALITTASAARSIFDKNSISSFYMQIFVFSELPSFSIDVKRQTDIGMNQKAQGGWAKIILLYYTSHITFVQRKLIYRAFKGTSQANFANLRTQEP